MSLAFGSNNKIIFQQMLLLKSEKVTAKCYYICCFEGYTDSGKILVILPIRDR